MNALAELPCAGETYFIRRAVADDLEPIVALLREDEIGAAREGGPLAPYLRAFSSIEADPAQLLVAVSDSAGTVVGTMQVTFIPGLARKGALRAQIEAVRVAASLRGRGLGAGLLGWAVAEAERRGCALVQLTSDKRRPDAHRLYERLGFSASHEGFKLHL